MVILKERVKMFFKHMDILFLCMVVVAGLYVYEFLRYDTFDVSLISLLKVFDNAWAADPKDWLGLYYILNVLPLYSLIFVVFVFSVIAWLTDLLSNDENKLKESQ